jgi:hypothetical protein
LLVGAAAVANAGAAITPAAAVAADGRIEGDGMSTAPVSNMIAIVFSVAMQYKSKLATTPPTQITHSHPWNTVQVLPNFTIIYRDFLSMPH